MKIILYADTLEDARDGLIQHMKDRATRMRETRGRTKTETAINERAALELQLEAEWLSRVEFEPRANAPRYNEKGDKVDMTVILNEPKKVA